MLLRIASLSLVVGVTAVMVAACASEPAPSSTPQSITLLTQPAAAQGCDGALAQGTLVPDPRSGLALDSGSGERTLVMWPFGYSIRLVDGVIELVESSGALVAREGDMVQMGGGFGANGLFYSCSGGIVRVRVER